MAPHAPSTTPTTVPITDPRNTRRRLTPMRRHSSSDTGWPPTVVPKSPRMAPDTQWPYRTGSACRGPTRRPWRRSPPAVAAGCAAKGCRGDGRQTEARPNVRNDAKASSTSANSAADALKIASSATAPRVCHGQRVGDLHPLTVVLRPAPLVTPHIEDQRRSSFTTHTYVNGVVRGQRRVLDRLLAQGQLHALPVAVARTRTPSVRRSPAW